jgi:TonB family protein
MVFEDFQISPVPPVVVEPAPPPPQVAADVRPDPAPPVGGTVAQDIQPRAGGRRVSESEGLPEAGRVGREQATRDVAEALAGAGSSSQSALEDLKASLATNGEPKNRPAARRGRVGGGRSRGELDAPGAAAPVGDAAAAAGSGPIQAKLIDVESITDIRSHGDLASTDPGGAAITGSYRTNASLLAVVRRYAAGIQFCYDHELKRNSALRGKMVLLITVLADGRVSEASIVDDGVGAASLRDCVLSQVREWRFPAIPEGTVSFRTPFVFTPPGS